MVEGLNVATHSIGARTIFRTEYGETIQGHSNIRWYCQYEQAKQQQRNFEHLLPWVEACDVASLVPQTVVKLRRVLAHPLALQLELSANVDAFDIFVSKCYTMEGDAVILVFCVHFDWLQLTEHVAACRATTAMSRTRTVAAAVVAANFPHLLAVAAATRVQSLVQEQVTKVEPAFAYFDAKTIYRAARPTRFFRSSNYVSSIVDPRGQGTLGGKASASCGTNRQTEQTCNCQRACE
jgi:hypothetical protein